MQLAQKFLSLSNWPHNQDQFQSVNRLSPLTQKILTTAKIDVQDLFPLTIKEFIKMYEIETNANENIEHQYEQQMELRGRRVQLLKSLWEKMNKKRLQASNRNSSTVFNKKCNLSKTLIKHRDVSPLNPKKKKKSKSPSPLIFKATSRKKKLNTEYFNDYNNHRKHNSNTDESTKSKPTISAHNHEKKSLTPNDDYFQSQSKIKNRKHKGQKTMKEGEKEKLVEELGNLINKWSIIYERHSKQQYESSGMTEKERRRLEKMHEIEKKQLKDQIEVLNKKIHNKIHKQTK